MESKKQNPPGATGGLGNCLSLAASDNPENIKDHLVIKAKNLAALVAPIDPATVAGLAFILIWGGPMMPSLLEYARPSRQVIRKALRAHQTRALEMLGESLASGKKRPLIQAPTGFGKTLLAARIWGSAHRIERGTPADRLPALTPRKPHGRRRLARRAALCLFGGILGRRDREAISGDAGQGDGPPTVDRAKSRGAS